MKYLINGIALSVFLLGFQQAALADECVTEWRKSSASKSCGTAYSSTGNIKMTEQGQCHIEINCSTIGGFKNNYPNTRTVELADIHRLENNNGILEFSKSAQ